MSIFHKYKYFLSFEAGYYRVQMNKKYKQVRTRVNKPHDIV